MSNADLLIPPKPANSRYESLDLWRGAACLMLVLYHATFYAESQFRLSNPSSWSWAGLPLWLIRYCWAGVPIFFVISGYCISASIDSLRRRPHSLRDYFLRRFRRIYPPLWIMYGVAVLFTLALSLVPAISGSCPQLPRLAEMSAWQWAGNLLAAESWRHHLVGGEPAFLMQNTWTLCYEEQFYLITGLLLTVARRRFFLAAGWLTAAVVVVNAALRGRGIVQEGFFWDGHWFMFAAGILVYYSLNYLPAQRRIGPVAVLFVGTLYGAADRLLAADAFQRHLGECICVGSLFALGLLFARRWDPTVAKWRLLAPLRWCGERSYSIYLTHYLLVVVVSCGLAAVGVRSELLVATVAVPVCLAISLPIAVLFHHGVERRFMNQPVEAATRVSTTLREPDGQGQGRAGPATAVAAPLVAPAG